MPGCDMHILRGFCLGKNLDHEPFPNGKDRVPEGDTGLCGLGMELGSHFQAPALLPICSLLLAGLGSQVRG